MGVRNEGKGWPVVPDFKRYLPRSSAPEVAASSNKSCGIVRYSGRLRQHRAGERLNLLDYRAIHVVTASATVLYFIGDSGVVQAMRS